MDPWEKDPQGSKMSCQDIGGGGGSVLGQGQALGVPAEREALARAGADASVEEGRVPLESPPTLPPTLCGPRTPIQCSLHTFWDLPSSRSSCLPPALGLALVPARP